MSNDRSWPNSAVRAQSLHCFYLYSFKLDMCLVDLALPFSDFLRALSIGPRFSQVLLALGKLLLSLRHLTLRILAQRGIRAVRVQLSERGFEAINALRIAVRLRVGDLLLHRTALRIATARLSGTHHRKDDEAEYQRLDDRIQESPPNA